MKKQMMEQETFNSEHKTENGVTPMEKTDRIDIEFETIALVDELEDALLTRLEQENTLMLVNAFLNSEELNVKLVGNGVMVDNGLITLSDLGLFETMYNNSIGRRTIAAHRTQLIYLYLLMLNEDWTKVVTTLDMLSSLEEDEDGMDKIFKDIKEETTSLQSKLDLLLLQAQHDADARKVICDKIDRMQEELTQMMVEYSVRYNHPEMTPYEEWLKQRYSHINFVETPEEV
jgi:hypothetical protein